MKTLEKHLTELQQTWGYTSEELDDIATLMKAFAIEVLADKSLQDEILKNA
jgi:hypothetical protein